MTFSQKHFYERINAGTGNVELRANQPMDAGTVWTLVDNVAHMVDVSPKYRINFLDSSAHGGNIGLKPSTMYFYTQITVDNQYPRYDLRVAFGLGNNTVPVRASIVTVDYYGPVTGLTSGVLGTFTGTSPGFSDPVAWTIDGTIDNVDIERAPLVVLQAPTFPGGEAIIGYHAWLKLIIEWDYVVAEGGPNTRIIGVQLREFPA